MGFLDTKKKNILRGIEELDIRDDCSKLSGGDRLKRMDLISQLRIINKKLDSLFMQKARAK